MRRNNFLAAAFAALLTFIALSAFVGPRHGGWRGRWNHQHCYYDNPGNQTR